MNDRLKCLPGKSLNMQGEIGKALNACKKNRLCTMNYKLLTDVFLHRSEKDNRWRCEYWGKNIRGAILACYLTGDQALKDVIRKSVNDMLEAQTPDGCFSSYPTEKQLETWDIWGRKYTIIGLMRYYELLEQDPRIPDACVRALDFLYSQMKGKEMREFGEHQGLAACSILDAIVMVYRATKNQRILDYALKIANSGCSLKHNVFQEVLKGTTPRNLGNAKAYEMSSCFQGLAQLQEFVPNDEWKDVVVKYMHLVAKHELMVTGMLGCGDEWGEYWHDGSALQTSTDIQVTGSLGETCIITTWLHYCNEVLRLTGDPAAASFIQRTAYNSMLGAMEPTGVFWTHQNPTPLAGPASKFPSPDQMFICEGIPFDGQDCCRAQGPEGLAMLPAMAVMQGEQDGGYYFNLYENLETANFRVTGNYPFAGNTVRIDITRSLNVPLNLFVPEWLVDATLDGKHLAFTRNQYLRIATPLKAGQTIELSFDMSVKVQEQDGFVALFSGPIVLVQESGLGTVGEPLKDLDFHQIPAHDDYRMLFANQHGQLLCDYASADRQLSTDVKLQVWLNH